MSLASPKCAGLSFVSVIFVSMLATSVYFIVNASERRTYMLSSNCTATGVDIVATKDHCARKRASCRYVYTPYWNVTYRRNDDMIVKAVGVCAYGCGSFPSRIAASSLLLRPKQSCRKCGVGGTESLVSRRCDAFDAV